MVSYIIAGGKCTHTVKFAGHLPCISVQTHNDTFDTPTVLGASTFCKKLVYLLFCRVETQVTNLEILRSNAFNSEQTDNGRLHIGLSTWQAYHSASDGRRVTESPYNWRVGPRRRLREPLGIQVAVQARAVQEFLISHGPLTRLGKNASEPRQLSFTTIS